MWCVEEKSKAGNNFPLTKGRAGLVCPKRCEKWHWIGDMRVNLRRWLLVAVSFFLFDIPIVSHLVYLCVHKSNIILHWAPIITVILVREAEWSGEKFLLLVFLFLHPLPNIDAVRCCSREETENNLILFSFFWRQKNKACTQKLPTTQLSLLLVCLSYTFFCDEL